jgi:5-methylcytosine-specific restriction endonuclease McrA
MKELPYINDPDVLKREFRRLVEERENLKTNRTIRYSLSRAARKTIWLKTDGKCHVCGRDVEFDSFEADHVKNHSGGGSNQVENFLPACRTCNNYRWHYTPDEIQWIFKLGIWAKTTIDHNDNLGKLIAVNFIRKEISREKRRKSPREALK